MALLVSPQQLGTPYRVSYEGVFRPLTDDGDAFRLAVLLRIDVNHIDETVYAWADLWAEYPIVIAEPCTNEASQETRLMAKRRAITKCAAEYQLRREQQK